MQSRINRCRLNLDAVINMMISIMGDRCSHHRHPGTGRISFVENTRDMSKSIKTLQDAMTYELQGLLHAERKIKHAFHTCSHHIESPDVTSVIKEYVENADDVDTKLNRIFNYLMIEPIARRNEIINAMTAETQQLLTYASPSHLKDILMIGCIKNINAYKTASFQTLYLMAVELELDTVADLLQQVLEWELAIGRRLSVLSIHEFNKSNAKLH